MRTGPDSEAVVLSSGHLHLVSERSELRFDKPSSSESGAGCVSLLKGIATFLFPAAPDKKTRFEAVSNSVVAAVKGTIFPRSGA